MPENMSPKTPPTPPPPPQFGIYIIAWLVGLMFNVPVNSYGRVEMASSPNHTFFLGKLD